MIINAVRFTESAFDGTPILSVSIDSLSEDQDLPPRPREYFAISCDYCQRFARETLLPRLREEYRTSYLSGVVRFLHHYYEVKLSITFCDVNRFSLIRRASLRTHDGIIDSSYASYIFIDGHLIPDVLVLKRKKPRDLLVILNKNGEPQIITFAEANNLFL